MVVEKVMGLSTGTESPSDLPPPEENSLKICMQVYIPKSVDFVVLGDVRVGDLSHGDLLQSVEQLSDLDSLWQNRTELLSGRNYLLLPDSDEDQSENSAATSSSAQLFEGPIQLNGIGRFASDFWKAYDVYESWSAIFSIQRKYDGYASYSDLVSALFVYQITFYEFLAERKAAIMADKELCDSFLSQKAHFVADVRRVFMGQLRRGEFRSGLGIMKFLQGTIFPQIPGYNPSSENLLESEPADELTSCEKKWAAALECCDALKKCFIKPSLKDEDIPKLAADTFNRLKMAPPIPPGRQLCTSWGGRIPSYRGNLDLKNQVFLDGICEDFLGIKTMLFLEEDLEPIETVEERDLRHRMLRGDVEGYRPVPFAFEIFHGLVPEWNEHFECTTTDSPKTAGLSDRAFPKFQEPCGAGEMLVHPLSGALRAGPLELRICTLVTGKVESGCIKRGNQVCLMPHRRTAEVVQIWSGEAEVDEAARGDIVRIRLDGLRQQHVLNSVVLCDADEGSYSFPVNTVIGDLLSSLECEPVVPPSDLVDSIFKYHETLTRTCRRLTLLEKEWRTRKQQAEADLQSSKCVFSNAMYKREIPLLSQKLGVVIKFEK